MPSLFPTPRARWLTALALAAGCAAVAAPTTTSGEDDPTAAPRPTRGTGAADAGGGESRTVQMLLELQSSRAPLEGGERARPTGPGAPALPKPAAAPLTAAPAPTAAQAQNPFSRALEMGKPAATRELRSPTVSSGDAPATKPVATPEAAALRGERYGEGGGPEAEQALREKIGVRIPLPVALMNYIRENRTTVLLFSLASLALVGWAGARATHKRG
jgi:hypothetical protein